MRMHDDEVWSVETASARELEIQALRCEEAGHSYENCCTILLHVYQQCRWCGQVKP